MTPATVPLLGGLDQETPATLIPPGRLIACLNHESVSRGYQRVQGYERFDGRPAPSEAAEPDRTTRRTAIQPVPGDGPVRGVLWYAGKLHAWRDNSGAGFVYQSTSSGWTTPDMGVQLGFDAGTAEINVGDTVFGGTSGASGVVRSIALDADSDWCIDASGTLILDGAAGVFEDNETLTVGGNPRAVVNGTASAAAFPAGGRYEFVVHNFYGSTGFERAYGANGVGQAFEYSGDTFIPISTGMPDDKPFLIAAHKNHLFLGFPKGSLQHSDLGEPRSFTARLGAAELGIGHELTAIIPNTDAALLVVSEKNLGVLLGNDSSDWVLDPISDNEAGGKRHTAQRIGEVIYLDARGIRSIRATETMGNFRMGTYTNLIHLTLEQKRKAGVQPVASCVVKSKDQYLLFFDDGSGISIYFGRQAPEPMLFTLPFVVSCITVAEVDGVERVFAGSTTGYVYELNRGTSFDGAAIAAFAQFAYGHQGSPRIIKRYHKTIFDLAAEPGVQLSFAATLDYALNDQPFDAGSILALAGSGGTWGDSTWMGVVWSAPTLAQAEAYMQGLGMSMSPMVFSSSATMESYVLQAMTVLFTPRAMKR